MPADTLPAAATADRDLLLRVKEALIEQGYGLHRTLEISVRRGVVAVQGRVPSFYQRQVAVECLKHVKGVTQVVDRTEVEAGYTQSQASDSLGDEQESSARSTWRLPNLPVFAKATPDAPRFSFRTRYLLSSAK
jgi:hypothetical protein